jgi:transposase
MGCGSGMTCWRRLRDWQNDGVWDKIHRILLNKLRKADKIDFSRTVVDSASVRAVWGAKNRPKSHKTDRCKNVITDVNGIPLAATITGANRHDITQLIPLVEAIPPIAGKQGRPRRRPDVVQGDRGYDSQPHRLVLRLLNIRMLLAKRRTANGSGLGKTRWVVERTLACLHQLRRLRVRYECRSDIHEAFLTVGCIIICWNQLNSCC